MISELQKRGETIEECYEFMLAYAAQGLPGDGNSTAERQLREFLTRAVEALDGLSAGLRTAVKQEELEPASKYNAFLNILERDALDSLATLELVLAQPVIGSQLIDNLNASIHLRALLTDIFLIGDIISLRRTTLRQQD